MGIQSVKSTLAAMSLSLALIIGPSVFQFWSDLTYTVSQKKPDLYYVMK